MFQKMLKWLRQLATTIFGERAPYDPSISGEMETAINLWAQMYEGSAPWCKGSVHSLRLPGTISAEFARLVTLEMGMDVSGSARADFLQKQLQPMLKELRCYVEFACALGGVVFKPYVSGKSVCVEAVQADCFVPLSFSSGGRITSAVFFTQIRRGDHIYTHVERHVYTNGKQTIENKAFESSNGLNLGKEIPLTEVSEWADLIPEVTIGNIDRPLFAYFRIPLANNRDRSSPLGISVFSEAVETIRDADQQYGRYMWEFEGGELAVDVSETALRHNEDGTVSIPKREERLFRSRVSTNDLNFYHVFSPQLRDESMSHGLNDILKRIEFQTGLAYGTLSDPSNVDKTATEIISSKQRSYATVHDIQKALGDALDDLVYAMNAYATLYHLAPAGNYETSYDWDDSIINDPLQRKQMFWGYVTAGKFPMWRYLKEFEGYSEDDAKAIAAETSADAGDLYADA